MAEVELLSRDIDDWRITLRRHRPEREPSASACGRSGATWTTSEIFLANYGDTLTDAPLDQLVERFRASDAIAAFVSVKPTSYSFHLVHHGQDGRVDGIEDVRTADMWINGGYFMFRPEIFDHIQPGDELVEAPFRRLIELGRLHAFRYDGFWAPMDTLKDVQNLESQWEAGDPPWALWSRTRERRPMTPATPPRPR